MLISALILGLLSSLHCIGMCGPIAFMLPVDRRNPIKQFFQIMSYHLGRLTTYSLIGLIFGFLGKSFRIFGFQQQLSIIAGVLMILIILLPQVFQKIKIAQPITKLIGKIKSGLGKELKNKRNDTFFTIGFLNGYLPCGMVYMAVIGAISLSSPFMGSLYMLLFGIGTIPLMSAIVYAGNFTNTFFKQKVQKIIPIIVISIGILFILRGLGLNIPFISPHNSTSTFTNPINGCK